MFSMQPRSPRTTASAPLVTMCWHLLSASRAEISPNLTANVPPKPQHVSQSAISESRTPSILREQRPRLRLDAHFAQARAGIVIGDRAREGPRHAVDASAR